MKSQIIYCRKQMAFERWKASGYRDIAAWNEFIRYFEELTRC